MRKILLRSSSTSFAFSEAAFPQPLSTLQISERMLEKMSDTSRIVDRLIAKGLVKKLVPVKKTAAL